MANSQDIDLKIKAALDSANAASGLKELKTSMKELQSLAAEFGDNQEAFEELATAAGQIKGRIDDIRGSIQAVSGDPIENVTASLNLAKSSLAGLDFGQASQGVKLLASNIKGVKFGDLSKGVGELTTSLVELGKAILTNPLLLIAGIIILLIAKFDELKAMGGKIGAVFVQIGKAVKFVIDAMIALADATGLTAIAAEKRTTRILKGLEREREQILSIADLQAKIAADIGKAAEVVEAKRINDLINNSKKTIEQYNILKKAHTVLTEDQKTELNKATATLRENLMERQEFQIRTAKQTSLTIRDNALQNEQSTIDIMAEGAAKIAAQADLDRRKETIALRKDLDNQLDITRAYYSSLLNNDKLSKKEIAALKENEAKELANLTNKGNTELNNLTKKQNKIVREDNLARRLTTLTDTQKLAQDRLQLELDNFKNSDAIKLKAQKDFIAKSIALSNQSYDTQIEQARGSAEKQKFLQEEKLLAEKKLKQDELKLEKDYADNQKLISQEKQNIKLNENVILSGLLKEFSITHKQHLEADLSVLRASNDKTINDDWNTYKEKIKNVNLTSQERADLLEFYNKKEIQNKEATEKRKTLIENQYLKEQRELLLQNITATDEIELDNLKRLGGIKLDTELALLDKLNNDKQLALQNSLNDELKVVNDNEQQKNAIREKYRQLEIQQDKATFDLKVKAIADTTNKVIGYVQYGADIASAIGDLANQADEKKRDKDGKMALNIQKKIFNRNKALGIANAVINTAAAVTTTIGTLGIPAGIAPSIAAGIMGALQIAKISATQFNPEGGSSGGGSVAAPVAPSMATAPTLGGNNSMLRGQSQLQFGSNKLSKLGTTSTNNNTIQIGPVKAYVVENEITSMQKNVATTQTRTTLSGI